MRSIIASLALLIALTFGAQAQITTTGAGGGPASAPSYTGLGNVVSGAKWYWSCSRAYSAATRGTKVCNVCKIVAGVASNCADISSDATTGIVASPTIGGALCSTITCGIATIYDQTGNGNDCVQGTAANMPILNVATNGSAVVIIQGTGGSMKCSVAAFAGQAQPFTWGAAALVNPAATGAIIGSNNGSSGQNYFEYFGTTNVYCTPDNFTTSIGITTGITFTSLNTIQCVENGASSSLQVNATNQTGTLAGGSLGTNFDFPYIVNNAYVGKIAEGWGYGSALTGTQLNSIHSNISTFYGSP